MSTYFVSGRDIKPKYIRFLARSVVHARMRAEGVRRPHKPRKGIRGDKLPSVFAITWREVLVRPDTRFDKLARRRA